jgi:hypothetical protein
MLAELIHSMFQLPFGGFIPDNSSPQFSESTKFETKATLRRHFKMSGLKKSVIRNMELLIMMKKVCFVQIYWMLYDANRS